jgi:hypothetical protein
MKKRSKRANDELLPEYDFSNGVRGKYSGRVGKDSPVYFRSEAESQNASRRGGKKKKASVIPGGRTATAKRKSKRHSVPA